MDYKNDIADFIKENFTPSDADKVNVKLSTVDLLKFIFQVFPDDCISDYDLVAILKNQGFQIKPCVLQHYTEEETKSENITKIHKSLGLGWCMKSEFNLETEVFRVPKKINQ